MLGTQVIEQPLDMNVDLLVTDSAPMDLLLQRIGRRYRYRYRREQRPALADAPR
ncbi:hypothetical protein AB0B25_28220 [Nocardia sp. NPDC049190]|uniref:hypothetical protein n=1 Tax=Nocardia sp. NPDC049190 TaxID=3155650 RepID=UPI0033CD889F